MCKKSGISSLLLNRVQRGPHDTHIEGGIKTLCINQVLTTDQALCLVLHLHLILKNKNKNNW